MALTPAHHNALLSCLSRDDELTPALSAYSVGYELHVWRAHDLADKLIEALPSFALNHEEQRAVNSFNAIALIRKAARTVYATDKYKMRGEFGELLLHVLLMEHYNTIPAVSKLYYKDSPNDTVKGFDAVHVVATETALELWLGEVKFYADIYGAIKDVVSELHQHSTREYLRTEFPLVCNKIEPGWPHAAKLKRLLDPSVSLDQVFAAVKVPVLLTYDSRTVNSHRAVTAEYITAFQAEVKHYYDLFRSKALPEHLRIVLMLVPLESKSVLSTILHDRLNAWKAL